MQVRFHRNIAASSLAAGCNVPQRPPAVRRSFTSIQMVNAHTHMFICLNANRICRYPFNIPCVFSFNEPIEIGTRGLYHQRMKSTITTGKTC